VISVGGGIFGSGRRERTDQVGLESRSSIAIRFFDRESRSFESWCATPAFFDRKSRLHLGGAEALKLRMDGIARFEALPEEA
jgi:hypothetical protein